MAKRFRHYDVTIGNATFEVCGETEWRYDFRGNDTSDIYNFYDKPSSTKVSVWNEWCDWAKANNAHLKVSGGNCMTFSIKGMVNVDGTDYRLWITKCYNRAYKVIS